MTVQRQKTMPIDQDLESLEREDTWDFATAERRPGSKVSRAVVSVAFSREDFELVGERAEQLGLKVSEFVRSAAIDAAVARAGRVQVVSATGSSGLTSSAGSQRSIPAAQGSGQAEFSDETAVTS